MKNPVALKVVAKASEDAETIDLELMNEIVHDNSWWDIGTSARDFANALKGKNPKNINVTFNSYGGVASEGVAMHNILRMASEKGAHVKGTVLGIAASAASIAACGCDELVMATGSRLMIHKAGIMGYLDFSNAKALRKQAVELDHLDETLATIYATRSGDKANKAKFLDLMDEETYLSADEAIELGLATKTDETLQAVACVGSEFLAMGMRSPSTAKGAPTESVATAGTHKENHMKLEELIAKFPEHAQALREEGRLQAKSDMDTAVSAERKRIQDVLALAESMPGHKDIVKAQAFDGKSTAGDVALAIVAAEGKTRVGMAQAMRAEAPKPVPASSSSTGAVEVSLSGLSVEDRAQKSWDSDPSIRADFDEFKDYLAYEKGKDSGSVNVFSRKEG